MCSISQNYFLLISPFSCWRATCLLRNSFIDKVDFMSAKPFAVHIHAEQINLVACNYGINFSSISVVSCAHSWIIEWKFHIYVRPWIFLYLSDTKLFEVKSKDAYGRKWLELISKWKGEDVLRGSSGTWKINSNSRGTLNITLAHWKNIKWA